MALLVKGRIASLLRWLLLTVVLLLSSVWLYKVTAISPAAMIIGQVERTLDYLLGGLKADLQWSAQSTLDDYSAGQNSMMPQVDALLLVENNNVLAYRSRGNQLPGKDELLSSMLGLLQTPHSIQTGVAYWRERTFMVAIAEVGNRKVLAATHLDTWLQKIESELDISVQLAANGAPAHTLDIPLVERPLPVISGGMVLLTASALEPDKLQGFPWLWSVLMSVVISACLVWFWYYRPLWQRINSLLQQCRQVMSSGDYTGRVKLVGKDELSELGVQINSIFSSLEYCYNLMAKTNMVTTELLQKVDSSNPANQVQMLSEEGELKASLDTVSRLSRVLDSGCLETCVQPIFASDKTTITSYQVLSRWLDDELGVVPAVDFVSLCESAGLVKKLTQVMVADGLAALRLLRSKSGDHTSVSIKLGAIQFTQNVLIEVLMGLSSEDRELLSAIEFEILEAALTHDFDAAAATIAQLKTMGAKICISQFGLSRYSLMYLQRVPVDRIKLAQAFTEQFALESRGTAFIEGVARFAAGLGITVVVQYLDSEEQIPDLATDLPIEYQSQFLAAMVPLEIALAS